MPKVSNNSYYAVPNSYLQQGDIFRIDLVAPAADQVQRIFRTEDGRHGSVVFEENCNARVFSRDDLENLLAATSRTLLYTSPFHQTPDGQDEMVVVFARLFRYFIIATQTCDISGKDKAPSQWATILPLIPIVDLCKTEPFPLAGTSQILTIHQFVNNYCQESEKLKNVNDMGYAPTVKQLLTKCAKSHSNKKVRDDAAHIKNYLSSYHKSLFMFPIPHDSNFNLPESYVDFTLTFTVPTSKLLTIRNRRFARINDPYRMHFAQSFGHFFERVALPKPMRPA